MESPELILSLAKEDKIDIEKLSIEKTMVQYFSRLHRDDLFDLKTVIKVLEIFCILQNLKLRALLHLNIEEDIYQDNQPLRYQEKKQELEKIVVFLSEQEKYARTLYSRPLFSFPTSHFSPSTSEKIDLFPILEDVMKKYKKVSLLEFEQEEFKIEEKMEEIMQILTTKKINFRDLIQREKSILGVILSFIAILELAKMRKLIIVQHRNFKNIWIWKRNGA